MTQQSKKNQSWLTRPVLYSLSNRPKLPIDDLEEDGTVLDVLGNRPSYKFKIRKKAEKALKIQEEWISFIQNKRKLKGDSSDLNEN